MMRFLFVIGMLFSSITAEESYPLFVQGLLLKDQKGEEICLKEREKLLKELSPYWNKPITKDALLQIKKIITSFYQNQGLPFINVEIPEQKIEKGVIECIIHKGSLRNLRINGAKNFSVEKLKESIRLERGDSLNLQTLKEDIAWINRNPFRKANIQLEASKEEGKADAQLNLKEKFPFKINSGMDNSGQSTLRSGRFFSGFLWGNAWGKEHLLSYQYLFAPIKELFSGHNFEYMIPLPWRHLLSFNGGYSRSQTEAEVDSNIIGFCKALQAILRYEAPLKGSSSASLSMGIDFKKTNVEIYHLDGKILEQKVQLFQLMLAYQRSFINKHFQINFLTELFGSFFSWLPNQNDRAYDLLQREAKVRYLYGKFSAFSSFVFFKGSTLDLSLRTQFSSGRLLHSEQMSIAGFSNVRGYSERAENGDSAIIMNLELRSPRLKVISLFKERFSNNEDLKLLLFFDYGCAGIMKSFFKGAALPALAGIGMGMRYRLGPFFSLRSDYGIPLKKTYLGLKESPKLHFGAVFSY